jgi:SAM-dependent methyltransferase
VEHSLALNRANWDDRAPVHAASADYGLDGYVEDPERLSPVVLFDRPRLGDVTGLRGVHLQCHIGTDTLSLARLGATMTGVDFSPASLGVARDLAARTGTAIEFVESEATAAHEVLPRHAFDLVYTGVGALCWLPSIDRWAETVAALLAPGGRLFLREAHPALWAIDESTAGALTLGYPYFETSEPLVFDDASTYVETSTPIAASVTHEWNHGLGEIVTALLDRGLALTGLTEHRSVPWEALPGRMVEHDGEWSLVEHGERLPLTYTLQAVAPR